MICLKTEAAMGNSLDETPLQRQEQSDHRNSGKNSRGALLSKIGFELGSERDETQRDCS